MTPNNDPESSKHSLRLKKHNPIKNAQKAKNTKKNTRQTHYFAPSFPVYPVTVPRWSMIATHTGEIVTRTRVALDNLKVQMHPIQEKKT